MCRNTCYNCEIFIKYRCGSGVFIFKTVRMYSFTGAFKTNIYFFKSFVSKIKLTNDNNESISSFTQVVGSTRKRLSRQRFLVVKYSSESHKALYCCYLRIHLRIIFTNVIRCSGLRLWVGYFIYFKFTRVSSTVNQQLIYSSIKETNKLISKGMCVLLFGVFNGWSLVQSKK